MDRFTGRNVLIVGGATGIGRAAALRVAREGAHVIIADINREDAARTVAELIDGGASARETYCNLYDADSIAGLFADIARVEGRLDAVHINGADLSLAPHDTDVVDVAIDVFDKTIQANLRGHMLCSRGAVPLLLERGGGSIVYTSSRAGLTSEPVRVSYAVAKSGIHGLMRHVALAWGKQGIRANVVAPGTILTPPLLLLGEEFVADQLALAHTPRLGEPEDIANAVAFLLSDDAAFINGQVISVDGGSTMQ